MGDDVKTILISEWAAAHYDPAPSLYVLRQWRERGEIHPAPERVGNKWMVRQDARRVTQGAPVRGGLLAQLGA
ncbi:MAG: hypothetical protein EBY24_23695 [Betaproteobacteria bacterium]|nr:hypothetical protein [Betaproteobacteria bacterium]